MNSYFVLSFSGGKDSTALLFWLLKNKFRLDEVIFVDLGKEHKEVYDVIYYVSRKIFPVTTLYADFDYYMMERRKTRGKHVGECGYGWPDFHNRWCTALKRDIIARHLRDRNSVINYVGIAANESRRARGGKYKKIEYRYPMVDAGISEDDALKISMKNGISWDGFYNIFSRASCWCCPFSKIGDLRSLFYHRPELWQAILEMDSRVKNRFSKDNDLQKLTVRFGNERLFAW